MTLPENQHQPNAGPRWSVRRKVLDLFVLVVFPATGMYLNSAWLEECTKPCAQYRMLSQPDAFGVYALYGLSVVAYAFSRSRPQWLSWWREIAVFAGMGCGVIVSGALILHFGDRPIDVIRGYPEVFLSPEPNSGDRVVLFLATPIFAPHLACVLQLLEILDRAQRRRAEGAGAVALSGVLSSPLAVGVYTVLMAVWRHSPSAAVHAFTETCEGTFGTLVPPPCPNEHYLCTVAAQGHPWLVRPQRWGQRNGRPVLVNRQLAVANAFEDLIHERWPRLGRLARMTYDRLGLPIARCLRWRWTADLCYLAMKPAEWGFLVTLVFFDRDSAEARIDRMYRE